MTCQSMRDRKMLIVPLLLIVNIYSRISLASTETSAHPKDYENSEPPAHLVPEPRTYLTSPNYGSNEKQSAATQPSSVSSEIHSKWQRNAQEDDTSKSNDPHTGENVILPVIMETSSIKMGSSSQTSTNPTLSSWSRKDDGVLSTDRHMILCQPPPEVFSPAFLGDSYCPISTVKNLNFIETIGLCNYLHSLVYGSDREFDTLQYHIPDIYNLTIITDERFTQICLPLVRRFNTCSEKTFITICWEEEVAFLHPYSCENLEENEKLGFYLSLFALQENKECFDFLCNGSLRVINLKVNGIDIIISNTIATETNFCGYLYGDNIDEIYLTVNLHWPCCYAFNFITWFANPEENGLNGQWSYLPWPCRLGEVCLLIHAFLVAVVGVIGNFLVVVVMISGKHISEESSMLRTSLAVADLLTSIFAVFPSLRLRVAPFLSPTKYLNVTQTYSATELSMKELLGNMIFDLVKKKDGYFLFQGMLFSSCSIVSLLTLFVLSVERYLITGRPFQYKEYFTAPRIKTAIFVIWFMGVINSVIFGIDSMGNLESVSQTFDGLLHAEAEWAPRSKAFRVFSQGRYIFLILTAMLTVMFSMLALRNFYKEQVRVKEEWKALNMRVTGNYEQENRRIYITMILMLVFYLLATAPMFANVVFRSLDYHSTWTSFYSYFSWWSFAAATAWNPWIYNMRSYQFKEDFMLTAHRIFPRKQGKANATHSKNT